MENLLKVPKVWKIIVLILYPILQEVLLSYNMPGFRQIFDCLKKPDNPQGNNATSL